jgi:phytoene/squalene synthetase
MSRVVLSPAVLHCRDLVRKADPDRLLLAELAPEAQRPALWALAAFNWEVERIPERVSESMLGAIRRQWWSDAWEEIAAGSPRRHPVVEALAEANERTSFDLAIVEAILQGREAEQDGPPGDMADLERWARQVGGGLARLEAQALGLPDTDAPAGIGAAWAQIGVLRGLPQMLRRGRHLLPAALLAEHRVSLDALNPGSLPPGWQPLVGAVAASAQSHLGDSGPLPPLFRGYRRLGRLYQDRMRQADWNLFDARINAPTMGRAWQVLRVRLGW